MLQVTVDGLRADLLTRGVEHFGDGGFRYLLENGSVFANAHYQHANTETIVGHATLSTGAQPAVHGMVGNVWYDARADALSADHGMPEAPEFVASLGVPAGRLVSAAVVDAAQRLGQEAFGLEETVKFYYRPFLYLRTERVEAAGLDPATVSEELARLLTSVPGIHAAVTRSSVERLADGDLATRIRNNFHRDRAGDIYIVQESYWSNIDPGPIAVMHGSPWRYDTHVPVIFAGAGVPAGTVYRQIQPADVAPTLAALLGMSAPASAQGTVLPEVFPHVQ